MQIVLTKHCIERFHERAYYLNLSEEELLEKISKGRIIRTRPGNAYELETVIEKEKHYFAIKWEHDCYTVITYLGNAEYREWVYKTEIRARYRNSRKRYSFKMTEAVNMAI